MRPSRESSVDSNRSHQPQEDPHPASHWPDLRQGRTKSKTAPISKKELNSISSLLAKVQHITEDHAYALATFTVYFCYQDESPGLELLASFFQPSSQPNWTRKHNAELLDLTYHCYQETAQATSPESADHLADHLALILAHTTQPEGQNPQSIPAVNLNYANAIKKALIQKDLQALQQQSRNFHADTERPEPPPEAEQQPRSKEPKEITTLDPNKLLTFNIDHLQSLVTFEAIIEIAKGARDLRQSASWSPTHKDQPETEAQLFHRTLIESTKQSARSLLQTALNTAQQTRQDFLQQLSENNTSTADWISQSIDRFVGIALNETRREFTSNFGFPIITHEAINWIKRIIEDDNLLEIGAGNGYLAEELGKQGFQVHATEPHPVGPENQYAINPRRNPIELEQYDGLTSLDKYPGINMLWSWPQPEDYTADVLLKFEGQYFIYIGEPPTGQGDDLRSSATGGLRFHQVLQERFDLVDTHYIPTFPNIHDAIYIYERKGRKKQNQIH